MVHWDRQELDEHLHKLCKQRAANRRTCNPHVMVRALKTWLDKKTELGMQVQFRCICYHLD